MKIRLLTVACALTMVVATPRSVTFALCFCPPAVCPTIREEAQDAKIVVLGTVHNHRPIQGGDKVSELRISHVLRGQGSLGGRKVIQLPTFVRVKDRNNPPTLLVFIDVHQGKLDPYRGVPVNSCHAASYFEKAVALDSKDVGGNLKFFFEYLEHVDPDVAKDAFTEFQNADAVARKMVFKDLPADRVAGSLKDPKTPFERLALFGLMLGHCGSEQHAKVLRTLLERSDVQESSACADLIAGYAMLKPKEALQYVQGIMKDPTQPFYLRYAALRATRFIWDHCPNLMDHKDLANGIAPLLTQWDIADLAIDDLRKWKQWDMTERIVGLQSDPVYKTKVVRRSMLRFALSNKTSPAARRYLEEQRQKDPDAVKDAEEHLRLVEQDAALP